METQKHPSRSKRPCCFDREEGRNSIAIMKSSATLHVFRMAEPQSNAESRKLCRCETVCPCASMKPGKPYRLLRACLVIRIHWKPPIHRSVISNRNTEGVLQIKRVLLINQLESGFVFACPDHVSCTCLPWRLQYCMTSRG